MIADKGFGEDYNVTSETSTAKMIADKGFNED